MKPILFNTEMVRAILDGRKTVTRRVVKTPAVEKFVIGENGKVLGSYDDTHPECGVYPTVDDAPYQPGDILYVRETWRPATVQCNGGAKYFYFADGNSDASEKEETGRMKWHPSIHMPKEAARIFLRVTGVSVERLQDIMLDPPGPDNQIVKEGYHYGCDFIATWENTIKPIDLDKYGWDANPWAWVIEFIRCDKPEEV